MDNKQLIKVLKQARALLAKRGGWIKGQSDNGNGSYCATGAIFEVVPDYERRNDAYSSLASKLPKAYQGIYPDPGSDIVGFNDRSATRKKDVLSLFDRAIKAAKKASK